MASFIRFVFALVLVGMAVNLAVVLAANVRGARHKNAQYQRDAARFKKMIDDLGGRVRRADIIVESQRLDGRDTALESTLLVRQYRAAGTSQKEPLAVVRITIPGNRLQVTGLMLEFDRTFAADRPDYAMLRDQQLVFFGTFSGAGEQAATQPSDAEARHSFLAWGQAPELIRLDPQEMQATAFETELWQSLWQVIPEPPRDAKENTVSTKPGLGVKVTWLKPATIAVRRTHTYTAYVSIDGVLTLGEDQPGIADLMDAMEAQGKRLPPR